MSQSTVLVCPELTGEVATRAARAIRESFSFGFVGVSLIPKGPNPVMQWGYADGARIKAMSLFGFQQVWERWGKFMLCVKALW